MCCVTGSPNTRRYTSTFSCYLSLLSIRLCLLKRKKQTPVTTLLVAPQDFELNTELKMRVIGFLEEVMHDPELLTQERKAAANIIRSGFLVYDRCICRKKKVSATVFMMPTIEVFVNDNFRTGGSCQELSWPKFMKLQFRGATERKHSSPFFMSNIDNFIRNGDLLWVL